MNNISGNAIPILITERPWGVSVVMLAPSVPCLRNFHPTTTFFFCEACFHHCADFSLYLFALSPLSLPSLSPLHASSTNPRCAFTPSAVSFLPFRFPIYPFRWLRFPLPSLFLFHTSGILNRGSLALIRRPATTQWLVFRDVDNHDLRVFLVIDCWR